MCVRAPPSGSGTLRRSPAACSWMWHAGGRRACQCSRGWRERDGAADQKGSGVARCCTAASLGGKTSLQRVTAVTSRFEAEAASGQAEEAAVHTEPGLSSAQHPRPTRRRRPWWRSAATPAARRPASTGSWGRPRKRKTRKRGGRTRMLKKQQHRAVPRAAAAAAGPRPTNEEPLHQYQTPSWKETKQTLRTSSIQPCCSQ